MKKTKKSQTKRNKSAAAINNSYVIDEADGMRPSDRPVEYNLRNPVFGRAETDGYNNGIDAPLQDSGRGY